MNWRAAIITALLVLPVVGLLAFGFGKDPHAVPSVLESKPAPKFKLPSLEGTTLSLDELNERPAVLNFWSSWCVPCAAEHEYLQQAARAYKNDITFVGIVYQDTQDNARRYLAEHGNSFVQLQDEDSKVAIDYGVAGVPESFFVDAQGRIRKKHVGMLTPAILQQELSALLGGKQ